MPPLKKTLIALGMPLFCVTLAAHVQASDFTAWKQSQQQGFASYLNAQQQAFATMLKSDWEEYSGKLSIRDNYAPKPLSPPSATPEDTPRTPAQPASPPPRQPAPALTTPVAPKGALVFLGHALSPPSWPVRLNAPLNDAKALAHAYQTLAAHPASTQLVQWLNQQRQDLHLGAWGTWQLVHRIAGGSGPETSVKVWFLLLELGYDVKLGFNASRIAVLPQVQQTVYWKQYYTSAGLKYVDLAQEESTSSRLFLHGNTDANRKPFDLSFTQVPKTRPVARTISLVNGSDRLDLTYDAELARYYHRHPTIALSYYFNAPLGPLLEDSLQQSWQRLNLEQGSQLASLNRMLGLVQYGVRYELDKQQFSTEEYYQLPEELLANGAGDCEDRSILFARMIRHLMKQDVIGLHYPGHVATAVKIDGAGTAYKLENARYLVADPTYIGSRAGEEMPDLADVSPSFIR